MRNFIRILNFMQFFVFYECFPRKNIFPEKGAMANLLDGSLSKVKDMFKLRHANCSQTVITNKTRVEINNYPDPLGFSSKANCLNTFEIIMIFGFLGLIATLPSLAYFLRMALREMELIKYGKVVSNAESIRYLADEPLSPGFIEFMKGENSNWEPTGNEFGEKSPPPEAKRPGFLFYFLLKK